jgi:hypothetical protein
MKANLRTGKYMGGYFYESACAKNGGIRIREVRWRISVLSLTLKNLFQSAATTASTMEGPFREFYQARVANGMQPALARLKLARKMAAIALILWKKGARPTPLQTAN